MSDPKRHDTERTLDPIPPPRIGISLAVYRIDRHGAHLVKPRRVFGAETDSPTWPFTRTVPEIREPPCECSPNCRYLHSST